MKTNKKKLSAVEKFQKGMEIVLTEYYIQALSESVKTALEKKRKKFS